MLNFQSPNFIIIYLIRLTSFLYSTDKQRFKTYMILYIDTYIIQWFSYLYYLWFAPEYRYLSFLLLFISITSMVVTESLFYNLQSFKTDCTNILVSILNTCLISEMQRSIVTYRCCTFFLFPSLCN